MPMQSPDCMHANCQLAFWMSCPSMHHAIPAGCRERRACLRSGCCKVQPSSEDSPNHNIRMQLQAQAAAEDVQPPSAVPSALPQRNTPGDRPADSAEAARETPAGPVSQREGLAPLSLRRSDIKAPGPSRLLSGGLSGAFRGPKRLGEGHGGPLDWDSQLLSGHGMFTGQHLLQLQTGPHTLEGHQA